jgi:hypothetical protein
MDNGGAGADGPAKVMEEPPLPAFIPAWDGGKIVAGEGREMAKQRGL